MIRHLDLFSGIGGFALAARWVGFETVQFVEINKFCQKVLRKHWPGIPIHDDIKTFNGAKYRGTIDLLTGGFPCQPFSVAGKRMGKTDDRYLWPEMLRVIAEVRPAWVIGENVTGIINMELGSVLSSLEDYGYGFPRDIEGKPIIFSIPACGINAPHRRDRVWILGYAEHFRWNESKNRQSNSAGGNGNTSRTIETIEFTRSDLQRDASQESISKFDGREKAERKERINGDISPAIQIRNVADNENGINGRHNGKQKERQESEFGKSNGRSIIADNDQLDGHNGGFAAGTISFIEKADLRWDENWVEIATRFCRMDDGISNRMDRLRALGNAIVPQIAFVLMEAIKEIESR